MVNMDDYKRPFPGVKLPIESAPADLAKHIKDEMDLEVGAKLNTRGLDATLIIQGGLLACSFFDEIDGLTVNEAAHLKAAGAKVGWDQSDALTANEAAFLQVTRENDGWDERHDMTIKGALVAKLDLPHSWEEWQRNSPTAETILAKTIRAGKCILPLSWTCLFVTPLAEGTV